MNKLQTNATSTKVGIRRNLSMRLLGQMKQQKKQATKALQSIELTEQET